MACYFVCCTVTLRGRTRVGDFGHGWSLTVGHPDLQVDLANNVTLTFPNGRRATFFFGLKGVSAGPVVLGFLAQPAYVPEPGVFGTLTSDGCDLLSFDPFSDNPDPICFDSLFDPTALHYAPTTYKYTDPYGVVYTMGADGTLKSIQDRNHNTLTFTPNGISSSAGELTVQFTRDAQGRITQIATPQFFIDGIGDRNVYGYNYDAAGNLSAVVAVNFGPTLYTYTYDGNHLLLTSTDPDGNPARTSTYDAANRLASDTDALGNVTHYAYDVAGHTTTTTYPDTGVMHQTFDDRGLLLSQTDQVGRTTTHLYDANRNETKRTNALGEATTYTYDPNGNQTSSANARGDTTLTTYNAFSEPLTTTNPIGNTTTIAYDDTGLPTSFTDSMGALASFTSSEQGLPTSVKDAVGNTVFLNYDAAGDLTQRTDRLGRITQYQFDGIGRKLAMIDPRKGVTTYDISVFLGFVDSVIDPTRIQYTTHHDNAGNLIDSVGVGTTHRNHGYTYDALNHLTKDTNNFDASSKKYLYDFRGKLLSLTDEVGNTTTYTYDLAGQLVQTTNQDATFTTQTYDGLGRLSSKTDERGHTTTYGYQTGCDCADRITSTTDPLGRTTGTTYDAMGRRTSSTDAAGRQTFYAYDLRGHLIETDYADGTATHDTYDILGRRTASTDQTGATTQYGYDAEGQLTSVTDPLEHVTQYAYDPNGNLNSVTDANNHVTTYAYDADNRKASRTLPLGMNETFTYDVDGNVAAHTDFRGKTTTYNYDIRNLLSGKVPDSSLGEPTVSYTSNLNSTRASMSDASGSTSYTYDARNRLLTKATPEGTLTYTYDPSGNLASIRSSNANGTSVNYAWDAANQLATVTDNRLGGVTTAAYTATGRPSTVAQPNGVGATYAYDSLDRVTSLAWRRASAPPPAPALASWAYTYNGRGQRLTSTEVTSRRAAYGYDDASRLTSETITSDPSGATGNGALIYGLDPTGNRLSRASTLAALGPQTFSYDPNDELTTDGYDTNGNTTSSGGHTYGYDFENHLVSKDGGAVTVVYDGDGNRVAKTVAGVTTQYLVDGLNPTGYLQVLDEKSTGTTQVRYTYCDMLVSQTRRASGTPQTSFYGYDAHGNVAFLTDATGAETDAYTYDAWGNLIGRTGTTTNTRLYVGEEWDPDLGLINLRNRYYNEEQGRFVTVDTSEVGRSRSPLSLNRYLYANADPSNKKDPQGLLAGAEYAIGLTTAQTLAVVVAIGAGAAVGVPGDVKVGEKIACEFQDATDELAAAAREPVVMDYPLCPVIQCFCHAEVYDTSAFLNPRTAALPPTRVHANDLGRSRKAAEIRCRNRLGDQLIWHPANVGEYDQTLQLGGVTIDSCRQVSP